MEVTSIAPGLWRWTGFHSAWRQEVACTYLESPDAVVLLDPLVPPEDTERFLRHLDAEVRASARPLHVVLTIFWHTRSAAELAERYGATLWAPARSVLPVRRRTGAAAEPVRPGHELPGGIVALDCGRPAELVYHLPEHEALVAGDVLLGGPLRICPESWLGKGGRTAVRQTLAPVLELPVQRVLVSHGEPVLSGGAAALQAALRA